MKQNPKTKAPKAPKTDRPLTIEIHGEAVDLVATIKPSHQFNAGLHEGFSKVAELFTNLNSSRQASTLVRCPAAAKTGECTCSEETVDQLQYEYTYYLSVVEHLRRELGKRGAPYEALRL